MPTLEELFDAGTGERCTKWRHYFEIYERYFARFRGTDCAYLEIGVWKGGLLQMMQTYLGERAKLLGVDIDPACRETAPEGVEVLIGDQADAGFMGGTVAARGPFDIVIDDGGHTPDQQLVSFLSLFPHMKEGGVYLVEDLHTTFWFGGQTSRFGINFYDFAKGLAEKLTLFHVDERLFSRYRHPRAEREGSVGFDNFAARDIFAIHFYDSVIVFEKRRREEPLSEIR